MNHKSSLDYIFLHWTDPNFIVNIQEGGKMNQAI